MQSIARPGSDAKAWLRSVRLRREIPFKVFDQIVKGVTTNGLTAEAVRRLAAMFSVDVTESIEMAGVFDERWLESIWAGKREAVRFLDLMANSDGSPALWEAAYRAAKSVASGRGNERQRKGASA